MINRPLFHTQTIAVFLFLCASGAYGDKHYANMLSHNTKERSLTCEDSQGVRKPLLFSIPPEAPEGRFGVANPVTDLQDYQNRKRAYASLFLHSTQIVDFEELNEETEEIAELIDDLKLSSNGTKQLLHITKLLSAANKRYVAGNTPIKQLKNHFKTMARHANTLRKTGVIDNAMDFWTAFGIVLEVAELQVEFDNVVKSGLATAQQDMSDRIVHLQDLLNLLNHTPNADEAMIKGLEDAIMTLDLRKVMIASILLELQEQQAQLVQGTANLGVAISEAVISKALLTKLTAAGIIKAGTFGGAAASLSVGILIGACAYSITELICEVGATVQEHNRLREAILTATFNRFLLKAYPNGYPGSLEEMELHELYYRNMIEAARLQHDEGSWIGRASQGKEYATYIDRLLQGYRYSADFVRQHQNGRDRFVNAESVQRQNQKWNKHTVIALIIDKSGSMNEKRKMEQAIQAAVSIVRSATPQNSILVVAFDSDAKVIQSICVIKNNEKQTIECIERTDAQGGTSISAGLNEAATELNTVAGMKASVILMTDGIDKDHTAILDALPFYRTANIPVHTVAFGDDAEMDILREIAKRTNGQFMRADRGSLAQTFLQLQTVSDSLSDLALIRDIIMPHEVREHLIAVPDGTKKMLQTVAWEGSRIGLTLQAPSGEFITAKNATDKGIDFVEDLAHNLISVGIRNPDPGFWKLITEGLEIPSGGEAYSINVSAETPLEGRLLPLQPHYSPGDTATIGIYINGVTPQTAASACLHFGHGKRQTLKINDRGMIGDKQAGDGIFSANLAIPEGVAKRTYPVSVMVQDGNRKQVIWSVLQVGKTEDIHTASESGWGSESLGLAKHSGKDTFVLGISIGLSLFLVLLVMAGAILVVTVVCIMPVSSSQHTQT